MSRRSRVVALFLLIGAGALNAGQNPPATDLQVPTFKVQVDYVEVDAVVTDSGGNFVRDLKREDFQVFDDGKPQTISTFAIVDIPVERYERPLFASQPLEPDVKTNEQQFDGRVYVMVIDDVHTNFSRTQRVKAAARKFVQEHLGANDLMAIVHTAGPADSSQDLTNSKRLLLAAVDKTFGNKLDSPTLTRMQQYFRSYDYRQQGDRVEDPREIERAYNAQQSLEALRDIAQWFASVHGRRKTILFFSEGIDYDTRDIFSGGPAFANTGGAILLDSMRDTIAAATRSNVSIYGIDPRGLAGLADEAFAIGSAPDDPSLNLGARSLGQELQLSQESLRELSDETGGFASVNTNDFSTAFDRIVRDNSSYYVLAYYPPTGKPGKVHNIDVKINRPGLSVRGRRLYVTPKPEAAPKNIRNTPLNERFMTPEIREVVGSPIPISGLTLYVFAAPFKGSRNASVLIGTEIDGADLRLDARTKLVLSYYAVDAQGKVRGDTDAITLNLRPETQRAVEQTGLRVLRRLDLPPGRYQLRVAAHDSGGGRTGSVLYDLEVPDFEKGALTMSGLVITSKAGATEPTVRADEQLQTALPGPPIAIRRFPQNDELSLFVETSDNQASKPHKVEITTTITTDEGKVLFKNNEIRDSTEIRGKRGGYGYATRIPLKDLAPGSYVLTVSARSTAGDGSAVQRQLLFAVGGQGMMGLIFAALLQGVDLGRPTMPPVITIDRGQMTWIDSPRQAVARTPQEWSALWRAHAPDRQPPTVDFSKSMVIAIFLGSRATAGYGVEILGTREERSGLVVRYRENQPPRDAITAQVITMPYHIVSVPAKPGEVKFERVEK